MFCAFCGAKNSDDAKFCGTCGKPLNVAAPAPTPTPQPPAGYQVHQTPPQYGQPVQPHYQQPYAPQPGYPVYSQPVHPAVRKSPEQHARWASIGAAIVIICFFLPWVSVSCSGTEIAQVSGWGLATGSYVNEISNSMSESLGGLGSLFGDSYNLSDYMDTGSAQTYPGLFLVPILGAIGFISLTNKKAGALAAAIAGVAGIITMIVVGSKLGGSLSGDYTFYSIQVNYLFGYVFEWIGFILMLIIGGVVFFQSQSYLPNPPRPYNY